MTRSVFTTRYERLRAVLIQGRKDAGLSQAEVAGRLKRPQTYVSKYERGERRLDVVEFLEVAQAIEIDPLEVIARLMKSKKE